MLQITGWSHGLWLRWLCSLEFDGLILGELEELRVDVRQFYIVPDASLDILHQVIKVRVRASCGHCPAESRLTRRSTALIGNIAVFEAFLGGTAVRILPLHHTLIIIKPFLTVIEETISIALEVNGAVSTWRLGCGWMLRHSWLPILWVSYRFLIRWSHACRVR